jgi:membrane protein HdeD
MIMSDPTTPAASPASATPHSPASTSAPPPGDLALRRTGWDVAIGLILALTGVVVLGDVVLASVISVLFLGWTLVIGGAVGVIMSLRLIGQSRFWLAMFGGVLALVSGVIFLRHPGAALLALSLAIGSIMLVVGITRLVAAVQHTEARWVMALSGLLSLVFGLLILSQWPTSALWLIGTLLGVHLILDGVGLLMAGRPRPAAA